MNYSINNMEKVHHMLSKHLEIQEEKENHQKIMNDYINRA